MTPNDLLMIGPFVAIWTIIFWFAARSLGNTIDLWLIVLEDAIEIWMGYEYEGGK